MKGHDGEAIRLGSFPRPTAAHPFFPFFLPSEGGGEGERRLFLLGVVLESCKRGSRRESEGSDQDTCALIIKAQVVEFGLIYNFCIVKA